MNDVLLKQLCQPQEGYTLALGKGKIKHYLQALIEAVHQGDEDACWQFHHILYTLNKKRLAVNGVCSSLEEQWIGNMCTYLEEEWLDIERPKIMPELLETPSEPEAFIDWFEELEHNGYGQNHPLFIYIAERASREELQYFFQQEFSTEAGFDDLVAYTQVKASDRVKMELAHNYWDEMGRGNPKAVHGFLLQSISRIFELDADEHCENVHWAPLALSNMMIALATKRSRFYQSIGALGVIELTAPGRCVQVMKGLKRIGLSDEDYHYYTLHSTLDRKHWAGWKENAVKSLLEESPASMLGIAEGALLRLRAGRQCFDTYSQHLKLDFTSAFPQFTSA